MGKLSTVVNADWILRFRNLFTPRDVIFHDGRDLRRFSIGGGTQAALASVGAIALCFSAYGVAHAGMTAAQMSGIVAPTTPEAKVAAMQAKLDAMKGDVAVIKQAANARATTLERRQQLITAVLSGRVQPSEIAFADPAMGATPALAADVVAPFRKVEHQQLALAAKAQQTAERRYAATADHLRKLGIKPERLMPKQAAMGGPYEPVSAAEATAAARADDQFRSLFMTWKKLDSLQQGVIAIPSIHPISAHLTFSSYFGVRSDPFRGTAAMHAGVDIPGPVGTPVYATADGIVERAQRAGGYGNMVELDHGKGIETRYGHLSKILVTPNMRVKRGQLIALMGSTGRSTGSHLHYEVRIDGHAVNPMPFLTTADYLVAMQDQTVQMQQASLTTAPESED